MNSLLRTANKFSSTLYALLPIALLVMASACSDDSHVEDNSWPVGLDSGSPDVSTHDGADLTDAAPADAVSSDAGPSEDASPDAQTPGVVCGEGPSKVYRMPELVDVARGCTRFRGSIDFAYDTVEGDMSYLDSIRVVEGDVNFFQNPNLRNLRGLERLEEVEDNFSISHAAELDDLTALRKLSHVRGVLGIRSMKKLSTLNGLSGIEEVGRINILDNDALTSLEGLSSLERVRGDVWIADNPKLPQSQIDAFLARVIINGEVKLD